MEMGRKPKKFPIGDSLFPYGVCAHLGINTYISGVVSTLIMLVSTILILCTCGVRRYLVRDGIIVLPHRNLFTSERVVEIKGCRSSFRGVLQQGVEFHSGS